MMDPIADMLARIRNASLAKKREVDLPMSKIKLEIAKILEREGWVQKVDLIKNGLAGENKSKPGFDMIQIKLKYKKSGKPFISDLKRISKPSLKVYVKKDELPTVLNNLGIAIISTPAGLMTNKEARKKNIGGEVICEIY